MTKIQRLVVNMHHRAWMSYKYLATGRLSRGEQQVNGQLWVSSSPFGHFAPITTNERSKTATP